MSLDIFNYYCDCLEELHTKKEKNRVFVSNVNVKMKKKMQKRGEK